MNKGIMMIVLSVILFSIVGCSTAGPFVTSISSDGQGNLIIQKGYAEFNSFVGVLNNKEAGETKIRVTPVN